MATEYEYFYFCGQLRYKCPHCPFDTYEIDALEAHIQDQHKPKIVFSGGPSLFDLDDTFAKTEGIHEPQPKPRRVTVEGRDV